MTKMLKTLGAVYIYIVIFKNINSKLSRGNDQARCVYSNRSGLVGMRGKNNLNLPNLREVEKLYYNNFFNNKKRNY